MVSSSFTLLRAAFLGGLVGFSALAPLPAAAQEGLLMRNMLGRIGLLPEEKEPIEYRERPGLVVPKDLNKLREPEPGDAARRQAAGQWPRDPDVLDRERERRRRNMPVLAPILADPSEGGRLSVNELAAGRSTRGSKVGEAPSPRNDYDGVRASIEEMRRTDQTASAPSYPPGTEPPRRYLTDPPTGLRIPSAAAPTGRRTTDGPTVDRFKVDDAWRRLD
ncbi:MAG: hypothetical protein O9322_07560 [Beijerinckiaceae bacterium]|nr:hypothetical protein [Beijerinckiaceae bacterium]MCZ8299383.1 hypothetical protein [Beijerinckiaceae bacterium]